MEWFMKKTFLALSLMTFSQLSNAVSIHYQTRELKGVIKTSVPLEQVQAQMGCVFENTSGNLIDTRVSPTTRIIKMNEGEYQLIIKGGSYREILPSYQLVSCHYKFIVLGRTLTGKAVLEDVFVMGSDRERMEANELEIFRNKNAVSEKLESLINPLEVF